MADYMSVNSLEQRMAQSYIDLFPIFVPCENAPVSVGEQKYFYDLINNLYQLAFNEPLLFVSKLHDDDAYPSRYKKPYGKPKLITDMKKFIKAIEALLQNMFLLGQSNDVMLNKRQQSILSRLGIEDLTDLPSAWMWMSRKESANLLDFSYCGCGKADDYLSPPPHTVWTQYTETRLVFTYRSEKILLSDFEKKVPSNVKKKLFSGVHIDVAERGRFAL